MAIKRKCVDNLKNAVINSDIIIFPLPLTKDGKNLNAKVILKENIDDIRHNFPYGHDDEVKIDKLVDLFYEIRDRVKEDN